MSRVWTVGWHAQTAVITFTYQFLVLILLFIVQTTLTHSNSLSHTKLPIYTCPICDKDFYNMMSSSARRHMRGCISKTENSHHRSKAKLELISHRATNYPLLKNSVKKYFDGRGKCKNKRYFLIISNRLNPKDIRMICTMHVPKIVVCRKVRAKFAKKPWPVSF